MKSVDLNANWSVAVGDERFACDFPYDATANAERDYTCAFGELNGYVPSAKAVFTRSLPQIKHGDAVIRISGACGRGEVFVNDESIGILSGYGPQTFYVPEDLCGAHNTLKIELFTSPAMSDKYLGLGIAGGVTLFSSEPQFDIAYDSLFVKTVTVGDRVYADAEMTVYNDRDVAGKFVLECAVLNARGKRAGKKQRKLFLRAKQRKTVTLRVRINNPYEWSADDPYMYTAVAKITDGVEDRSASARFGIVTRTLNRTRGLYINGRKTLLTGAYISHADAAIGAVSVYANEKRRLLALKAVGYNAVHYVGCPADAALDACDDTGMYAYVDIFSQLTFAKAPFGEALRDVSFDATESVCALRNHPSVTVYGVADDVPECYGRNNGHELIKNIAEQITEYDGTRPTAVSSHEFVPTPRELEKAGIKKTVYDSDAAAVNAGRERNLFEQQIGRAHV